jgi:hypothetical protein
MSRLSLRVCLSAFLILSISFLKFSIFVWLNIGFSKELSLFIGVFTLVLDDNVKLISWSFTSVFYLSVLYILLEVSIRDNLLLAFFKLGELLSKLLLLIFF